MPIRWATSPREPILDEVVRLFDGRPAGGVALLGVDGVGKTTLAEQIAERLGQRNPVRVTGTATQSAVPFGAFGPLVDIAEVGKPAALIHAALDSLLAQTDNALIIVDDAHLLDPLSATLVYQLAQANRGRLIVTARSTPPIPAAIAALWQDGLLPRIDIPPMEAAETEAVLSALGADLYAAIDPALDHAELYRRSVGNPLHLRLMVQTGNPERSLPDLVGRYVASLPTPARDVLAYLSVQQPLACEDLVALTAADAIATAEAAGAVRLVGSSVYSAHPLFAEQAGSTMAEPQLRRLRTEVAERLAIHPLRHLGDRLGRSVLALDSERPQAVDDVVAAAQEALRLGDLGLSERLATAALERDERFDARLALSYALAWQGRGREADRVLAEVDPDSLSEEQVLAWALPRAANQFWMLSEPERASAFLQTVRRRVSGLPARITLDALSATFAMNSGNVARALEIATEVLSAADAPDMAVAWASSAAALSSARMGRFADVGPLVDRALGAEYPGLLRFTVGLAETTTLLMAGRTQTAYDTALGFTDFAELAQPGRSIGELLLAEVLIARGEPAGAATLLAPASATLERTGYSWGPLSLTYLATALAQQGEIAESAKMLSRAESRHGTKSALFAPELAVARAWRLATIGDRHGAIDAAREGARMAERTGQYAIAVRAWHEAARLGDVRAADGLAKIAAAADCEYTRTALAHARELAASR
ncbi:ATP-binding protein [Mycolicibacterium sp.]|uniref:ATP-binding protein n=1 Tax=Mycolicibacterium sp. TaxID=2320850 RepID=UPI001A184F09|nr:ATP-binding protein [Mycolicibacterium sp.]MBJ7399620.1 ATP-binding protein [Mycolicibacterium sp.]